MEKTELLSIGKKRKLDRKLLKLQHVLKKETGIVFSSLPTNNLAICNAGLVNGITEEIVFEHFNQHGTILDIQMIPGKSCCFISYKRKESAINAFKIFNGKLNIAQDNKAIYLLYVENLPKTEEQKIWGELPSGLIILSNFINISEEEQLLKLCNFENGISGNMKHRSVKHFGYEFRYDINNVDKDTPLTEGIPSECDFLWTKLLGSEFSTFKPDQLTINCYSPGQGIPHHVDTHSAFEDPIMSLSLGSPIIMEFIKKDKHYCVLVPQRSLLIMSGESRYDYTHGIVPRKFDVVRNHSNDGFSCLKRGIRVSFTFRKVLQGECSCAYPSKCDSFLKNCQVKDNVASKLEALHVHEVYNNIAEHFSDTRHKPWPNVLEFVQSFNKGSVLVDVGCGNGKYLGVSQNIYDIGCDRSSSLIEICRERKFESFVGDCLSIPIKDGVVDGVISIAVIHHLSTERRRLMAIQEIVRILKKGGQALVYVWAHDQVKDQEKSSYIKQDRKNRKQCSPDNSAIPTKLDKVPILDGSVILPVHTNRTNFQAKDVLVPWKLKDESKTTFFRFYHVFEENELESICEKVENVVIKKKYYDQGNWCVILEKV